MLMKQFTLMVSALFLSAGAFSQIFSDDFESYSAGYLGPQSTYWTTWSGSEGGAEDVQISTAQASSGTQSIYLASTASTGGPQDVILDFGTQYTSGIFTFETDMFQVTNKNAYFNLQATPTIGQVWAFNFTSANGAFTIDDGVTPDLAVGTHPVNQWFTLKIEANLTTHIWKVYVNGVAQGAWINGVNTVASADIFPTQGSGFYIDDISFDHAPYSVPNLNATAVSVDMNGNIASQVVNPAGNIVNTGSTPITSFTATLNYDGNDYVQNVNSVNIASQASYSVSFGNVTLAAGSNTATLTISNVNGGSDDDSGDDVATQTVNPVVPAPGKMVVGEEGTGTWCQWCPRGAVFMDMYEQEFAGFWAGIAVHNADPMTVAEYDSGIGALISGYPSGLVDRGSDIDPSAMSAPFYQRLQVAPKAFISTNETWNAATRELTVEVVANFQAAATSSYKLACVLTEDNVTGTSSAYNQSNAYAGGSNGVMGGFESLPNPVPAAQMVYDHVARAIQPAFGGDANSFPATVNNGETYSRTYTFTLPASWDENEMHIIGMLIAPNGTIDNASKKAWADIAGVDEQEVLNKFSIYPNPATSQATVAIELVNEATVQLELVDLSGKVVASRNYGTMNGEGTIQLNTASMHSGVYFVKITVDGVQRTERLVIQ